MVDGTAEREEEEALKPSWQGHRRRGEEREREEEGLSCCCCCRCGVGGGGVYEGCKGRIGLCQEEEEGLRALVRRVGLGEWAEIEGSGGMMARWNVSTQENHTHDVANIS